jgi:hypothetical protein
MTTIKLSNYLLLFGYCFGYFISKWQKQIITLGAEKEGEAVARGVFAGCQDVHRPIFIFFRACACFSLLFSHILLHFCIDFHFKYYFNK